MTSSSIFDLKFDKISTLNGNLDPFEVLSNGDILLNYDDVSESFKNIELYRLLIKATENKLQSFIEFEIEFIIEVFFIKFFN